MNNPIVRNESPPIAGVKFRTITMLTEIESAVYASHHPPTSRTPAIVLPPSACLGHHYDDTIIYYMCSDLSTLIGVSQLVQARLS